MIGAVLAPLVGMLAKQGLDFLSGAVEVGKDAAIDKIAEKTGIDLRGKTSLKTDEIETLTRVEADPEFQLEMARIMSARIAEDHRYEEAKRDDLVADLASARQMAIANKGRTQRWLAGKIYGYSSILIPLMVVANVLALVMVEVWQIPPSIAVAVGNIIAMALTALIAERQKVAEFYFGSSLGVGEDGSDDEKKKPGLFERALKTVKN